MAVATPNTKRREKKLYREKKKGELLTVIADCTELALLDEAIDHQGGAQDRRANQEAKQAIGCQKSIVRRLEVVLFLSFFFTVPAPSPYRQEKLAHTKHWGSGKLPDQKLRSKKRQVKTHGRNGHKSRNVEAETAETNRGTQPGSQWSGYIRPYIQSIIDGYCKSRKPPSPPFVWCKPWPTWQEK